MANVLFEALIVGIATLLLGLFMNSVFKDNLAMVLFSTGILIHLLCEMSGVNKWYCTNGNACKVR
jgi:hypothetical protein